MSTFVGVQPEVDQPPQIDGHDEVLSSCILLECPNVNVKVDNPLGSGWGP